MRYQSATYSHKIMLALVMLVSMKLVALGCLPKLKNSREGKIEVHGGTGWDPFSVAEIEPSATRM